MPKRFTQYIYLFVVPLHYKHMRLGQHNLHLMKIILCHGEICESSTTVDLQILSLMRDVLPMSHMLAVMLANSRRQGVRMGWVELGRVRLSKACSLVGSYF